MMFATAATLVLRHRIIVRIFLRKPVNDRACTTAAPWLLSAVAALLACWRFSGFVLLLGASMGFCKDGNISLPFVVIIPFVLVHRRQLKVGRVDGARDLALWCRRLPKQSDAVFGRLEPLRSWIFIIPAGVGDARENATPRRST